MKHGTYAEIVVYVLVNLIDGTLLEVEMHLQQLDDIVVVQLSQNLGAQ